MIVWIAIKFGTDFHGLQRMFRSGLPDLLTFLHQ